MHVLQPKQRNISGNSSSSVSPRGDEGFEVVIRSLGGEERDGAEDHAGLDDGLAGKRKMQPVVAGQAINRTARPTEPAPAAHATRVMW